MALIDRQAISVLTADSETDWAFDKAVRCGCICDLGAPNYEIGNLSDSIRNSEISSTEPCLLTSSGDDR